MSSRLGIGRVSKNEVRPGIASPRQNPTELRIEDVFDAAWRVIGSREPPFSPPEEAALRFVLARLLVDLEARGVTDPRELRRRVIEEMLFACTE